MRIITLFGAGRFSRFEIEEDQNRGFALVERTLAGDALIRYGSPMLPQNLADSDTYLLRRNRLQLERTLFLRLD